MSDVVLPASPSIPTLYFVGVTTSQSSIQTVFPHWAEALGLGEVRLQGIDLPLHAPRDSYRRVVDFIASDPLNAGALVTTHKIDLFEACADMFDDVDPLAELMGETSCLSKRDGRFAAHAKDPISAGLALDAFLPPGYFEGTEKDLFLMGAGGSSIAISWYLSRPERGDDRPARIIVSNRSAPRLDAFSAIHEQLGTPINLETVLAPTPAHNDEVLAGLGPNAVVINGTGLGKDSPGSPLAAPTFPEASVAWDLNYRGDLLFLDQARLAGHVHVEDGWIYFLHGWTQVIAEVFARDVPTSGPDFDALGRIAADSRQ